MIKRKDSENARPVIMKTPKKRGETNNCDFGRGWFEEAFLGKSEGGSSDPW
jgi:hypothetical protein